MNRDLVVLRPQGLYCPAGDFFIDPLRPVPLAVITHAHADHARGGHGHYLCHTHSLGLLRVRLGPVAMTGLAYGERVRLGDVTVSLHPAGHVLGSAQVRIERRGEVWVASGDFHVSGEAHDHNPTCAAFESVRCHTFITESTFGLPIYRWPKQAQVMGEINAWWAQQAAAGRPAVLRAYSLGKAQRLLAGLDTTIGPIVAHPAVAALNAVYREAGVDLPATRLLDTAHAAPLEAGSLLLAPPGALGTAWQRRLASASEAFASGWMRLRGARRRQGLDRGFVLSDHADWPGLVQAIAQTGAERVIVTHGPSDALVRWLQDQGLQAQHQATGHGAEGGEPDAAAAAS
jgi:putative mRNA 3-end processing factor